jgi:hypothetical protein
LPVLYKNLGVMKEHLWCREKASLFDVSHMGQVQRFIYMLFVNTMVSSLTHVTFYPFFISDRFVGTGKIGRNFLNTWSSATFLVWRPVPLVCH